MITLGGTVKNEAKYIQEWLTHYHLLGVDRFIINLDRCTDDTHKKILDLPFNVKIITHTDKDCSGQCFQNSIYYKISRICTTEWLTLLDVDEFLFLPNHTLKDFLSLERFSKAGAISICQNIFGSSGHNSSPNNPVVDSYTLRNPDDIKIDNIYPTHQHPSDLFKMTKPIFRNKCLQSIKNAHDFKFSKPTVYEAGKIFARYKCRRTTKDIVINHYFTKSLQDWEEKTGRPRISGSPKYRQQWFDYFNSFTFIDDQLQNTANKVEMYLHEHTRSKY